MRRRQMLRGTLLTGAVAVAGCLGNPASGSSPTDPTGTARQSGSGHPCENPRNIDYQAVEAYRARSVYLRNAAETAHTACVTVTKADRTPEEDGSDPPPLRDMGYAIQPGMAVEIFTFQDPGLYTIAVRIEETTKTETFDRTATATADDTRPTTFEITGPARIRVRDGTGQ